MTWRHLLLFVLIVALVCLAVATLWIGGVFRPATWIRPLW